MSQEKQPWKLGRMASGFAQSYWPSREEAMAFFDSLRFAAAPGHIAAALLFGRHGEKWRCEGSRSAEWICEREARATAEDDGA